MKTNSVALDPEMAALLGDCDPGESKEITLTVTVDAMDDTGLKGTITAVEPYETEEEEADEEEPATTKTAGSKSKALMDALA